MSVDRSAEIKAILRTMQDHAQPGEQVTNIRKVKSYIAHLEGRITELEQGPGVKLVHHAKPQCRHRRFESTMVWPPEHNRLTCSDCEAISDDGGQTWKLRIGDHEVVL